MAGMGADVVNRLALGQEFDRAIDARHGGSFSLSNVARASTLDRPIIVVRPHMEQ
jgi:hypothetical protein